MPKTAMLVVDMQNALILEHPYDEKRLIKTISQMEQICRDKGIEVIFIRHEDNTLVPGENGFEIYSKVAPEKDEKIFNKIPEDRQAHFARIMSESYLVLGDKDKAIPHSITAICPVRNFITTTATKSGITAMRR